MRLTYFAYLAAAICLAGTLYRLGRWCVLPLGTESRQSTPARRLASAVRAVVVALLDPRRLWVILHAHVVDVIGQIHILRQSPLRWAMHMALCYGTLLLLLLHTFDEQVTARLFSDYASTLNPFMFLRNLLGLLVAAGVIVALVRRRGDRVPQRMTRRADRLLLVLLAAIIASGAALEATQIISSTLFDQMVVDYMGSDDSEEIAPLKAYWAVRFDVAFTPSPATDPALLEQGGQLHADYCAACHSHPASAVLAYPLALAIKPLAAPLARIELETGLWYAHYLISCLALTLLPLRGVRFAIWPMVMMIVSASSRVVWFSSKVGLNRLFASNTDRTFFTSRPSTLSPSRLTVLGPQR